MAYERNMKIAGMSPPASLRSEAYQHWCGGRGTDVWAMFCAAIAGDLDKIRELFLKDPALINCQYAYLTPLRFAVRENHLPVIEFLVGNGAKPVYDFSDGPVTMARDRGYTQLVGYFQYLFKSKYQIVPEGDRMAAIIREGDIEQIKQVLKDQPELLRAADRRGNQPIHWAVLTRQIDLVDHLLNLGADINALRPDGARPLDLTSGDYHYRSWYRDLPPTALRKHEMLVGYLVARGAEYDISVAAKMGDYARVNKLLEQDPELANRLPAYDGYYSGLPLRCAAATGHLEVVKLLLQRGANPNQPEPGIAPWGGALHAAIGSRHIHIVKLLLEHGANPNAAVESSGNCLSIAKYTIGSVEMTDLLVSRGAVLGIELAAYYGDLPTLSAALEADPALDMEPALGYIISEGHQQCMELVLHYQPGILKGFATWRISNTNFARWLFERGLDPNSRDWLGATLLHHTAAKGNIDLASVCLGFGADINAIDADYCSTPLGWAARNGKAEMVAWLLQRGADPQLPTDKQWALPLEWAGRRKYPEIIELLTEHDV